MRFLIGVDLGGTNIKTALVTLNGKIVKKYEIPTEAKKGTNVVVSNIAKTIESVKTGKIIGIGIGSPGPLNYRTGTILNPVNLPFRKTPLRKIIQDRFKINTFIDNDANCFALAEATFGQGKNYENVVGITLGTGVGGGVTINKKIYHGKNNAGELGHITINYDGPKSRCGNNGCIETHASARGIASFFGKKSDPKRIQELALRGNKKAIKTYRKIGYYLGIGITNIIYAFDPDIIIFGGKISNGWSLFQKSLHRVVKERYFSAPGKIVKSNLKEPGILGAAALVLQRD